MINACVTDHSTHSYQFGPFWIRPAERLLLQEGVELSVTPKAFDVLVLLIQRNGHLVEKSEIMSIVWRNSFVEEGNLAVAISALRKVLGDNTGGKDHKYIQTVAKRGYRFVGEIRENQELETAGRARTFPVEPAVPVVPLPLTSQQTSPTVKGVLLTLAGLLLCLGLLRFAWPFRSSASEQAARQSPSLKGTSKYNVLPGRVNVPPSEGSEAYILYMTGRYHWDKRTEQGLRQSIECFERATMEDPNFAAAYAGLADAYVLLDSYGVEPAIQAYPSAKAAALKSLELDDSLPEAHASRGMVYFFYEWNWTEAEREFQRAIKLDPNYAMAYSWYALDLVAMGRSQEALQAAQRAYVLAPLSLIINTEVGWVYYSSRQYTQAISVYQNVLDLDRHFARAHTRLGMVYAAERDFPRAIDEFTKARELSGPDPYVDGLLGYAEALSGNSVSARNIMKSLNNRSRYGFVPAFSMALISEGLGERQNALDWLSKSFDERSAYMVYAKTDPLLDHIRPDPQFRSLVDRIGLQTRTETRSNGATGVEREK
jgi:DNA-binding winged helix-turn-helix (wHTH) protein/Flp pilus assembly protein TadD